jgi:hypothetical protein
VVWITALILTLLAVDLSGILVAQVLIVLLGYLIEQPPETRTEQPARARPARSSAPRLTVARHSSS